jgi:hypothetical protein
MHTEGLEETRDGDECLWLIRWECRGCGLRIGAEAPALQAEALVDRLMWTDDARHRLERTPPYAAPLVKEQMEAYARRKAWRAISYDRFLRAETGDDVEWDPEAEGRLANVPAPVRAMARVELERTAAERGQPRVTVALMEEVKAKYFGLGGKTDVGR